MNDDTIYEIGTAYKNDNGIEILTIAATGKFEFEDGRVTVEWKEVEVSGEMTQPTTITLKSPVDGDALPSEKYITATNLNFINKPPLGSQGTGSTVIGGTDEEDTSDYARFSSRKAIYPSYGGDVQIIMSASADGAAFKWSSYKITARALTESTITLQ